MAQKKPTVYEFIPKLGQLRDDVLFGDVWEHSDLSKRDRSLITVAMLAALYRTDEMRGHMQRALDNGVTQTELKGLITHVAGADHPRGVLCRLALRGECWPYRHRGVRTEIALIRRSGRGPWSWTPRPGGPISQSVPSPRSPVPTTSGVVERHIPLRRATVGGAVGCPSPPSNPKQPLR